MTQPGRRARRKDVKLRATAKGMMAREVWGYLPAEIEARWCRRAGEKAILEPRSAACGCRATPRSWPPRLSY